MGPRISRRQAFNALSLSPRVLLHLRAIVIIIIFIPFHLCTFSGALIVLPLVIMTVCLLIYGADVDGKSSRCRRTKKLCLLRFRASG
ncbi:hypothetical protein QR685DRAFT_194285 [Neurospora intermedia]|uniref:Uncharacterized protein n=1 Tax=Neurospora intermedia TaxID=5142 RepID=A0ABR3DQ98_NEUIN